MQHCPHPPSGYYDIICTMSISYSNVNIPGNIDLYYENVSMHSLWPSYNNDIDVWDRVIHSPNRQWLIQIESGESNSGESRQNWPFWRLIINHKVAINFGKLLILYLKKSKRNGKSFCIMHLANWLNFWLIEIITDVPKCRAWYWV